MTPDEMDRLQALADAATPAPWEHYSTMHADAKVVGPPGRWPLDEVAAVSSAPEDYGHANARFIAAARTAVPTLIAALGQARLTIEDIDEDRRGSVERGDRWRDECRLAEAARDDLQRRTDAMEEGRADAESALREARRQVEQWRARALAAESFAQILHDLDRSPNGRHEGDAEVQDPTGVSQGNPRIRTGDVIGYDMGGRPYVMPERARRHDAAAWRKETA